MAKIILNYDIDRLAKEGDMLVYNAKTKMWVATTKELFLRKHTQEIEAFKQTVGTTLAEMQTNIENFKAGVNGKLKDYHEILQNITKDE